MDSITSKNYSFQKALNTSHFKQEALWQAVLDRHIDMVVSDHSPCTPDLKLKEKGDFLNAWGGISSLQFGKISSLVNCKFMNDF